MGWKSGSYLEIAQGFSMTASRLPQLEQYAWSEDYRISPADLDRVITPALAIFPEIVDANISATLRLLGAAGEPRVAANRPAVAPRGSEGEQHSSAVWSAATERWRAHVKTAKLGYIIGRLVERGVRNFKCATTLELLTALQARAEDVLLAYPVVGPGAERVRQIAEEFRSARVSVLVESAAQLPQWRGSRIGMFVDVNPGMNRTGIDPHSDVLELVRAIGNAGLHFRGLHYYDGHVGSLEFAERTAAAHRGYDQVMALAAQLENAGFQISEVITAGTPAFPASASYAPFRQATFIHRVSPGTVVYCDATSRSQLPGEYGYRPAALVISRVVSHPTAGIVTCDAGHKTVSADAGLPTCVVVGRPELRGLSPSEEHLPIEVMDVAAAPQLGEVLYLLPRHVCPTVNNFDHALIVRNGRIESVERVTARGREAPIQITKAARRVETSA
jgi:D-serine deaminase-like pyridoxal phosphate-dependent protein